MPRRKLPKHDELVKLFEEGWSYRALAIRYNCDKGTVYHTLKRGQERRRLPWPIQTAAQHRAKIIKYTSKAVINPSLIMLVVEEYCDREEISLREFAHRNNLSETWLYSLRSGREKKIRKAYAIKLLEACDESVPVHLLKPAV